MFTHPHCRPLCLFILFFSQMPQCSVKNCLSFNMILPPLFHLFSLFSLLSASLLYSSLRQLLPSPLCDCVSFSLSLSLSFFFSFSFALSFSLSISLSLSLSPSPHLNIIQTAECNHLTNGLGLLVCPGIYDNQFENMKSSFYTKVFEGEKTVEGERVAGVRSRLLRGAGREKNSLCVAEGGGRGRDS